MDNSSDLKMLQYYRHDIMNELQLVHGYLQMGNVNKAQQKITKWLSELHEERKLMYLNAPQFISWILMFNHMYDQIRLTYEIHTEVSLTDLDQLLVAHCNDFIHVMENNLHEMELYHIHITLEINQNSKLVLKLIMKGPFENNNSMITQLKMFGRANNLPFKITDENSEIICTWQYMM